MTKSKPSKPNILLIAIDSLLADHMSCYGYHRQTTPHIDRLATQGTLFERTYSAHIPTTPAYSSLLTGRDCFGTEVVALRYQGRPHEKSEVKTLAEVCKRARLHHHLRRIPVEPRLAPALTNTSNSPAGDVGPPDAPPRRKI